MDHRLERVKERYGLDMTPAELLAIEAEIACGGRSWTRMVQGSDGSQIGCVRRPEALLVVVWRPSRGCIVTFLPATYFTVGHGATKKERRAGLGRWNTRRARWA